MNPFDFESDDPVWDVIKKYGLTKREAREAVLAWLYVIANNPQDDDLARVLEQAFTSFHNSMKNVSKEDIKDVYKLEVEKL